MPAEVKDIPVLKAGFSAFASAAQRPFLLGAPGSSLEKREVRQIGNYKG
jgi:hypothetical protein